jgi:phthiodiolone/phenolphthiodiolone dimycocerosates ketoreductase
MISAIAATATENLGITTSTDAIRESPAELLRMMLTLASCNSGRTSIQIGPGELKQCKPFGFKRSEGLGRMEDLFRINRKLLDTDGLISHQGNHWRYDETWIGASLICGTPRQVSGALQPYIDAGANFLSCFDMTPSVTPLERRERAGQRVIELCTRLKQANPGPLVARASASAAAAARQPMDLAATRRRRSSCR